MLCCDATPSRFNTLISTRNTEHLPLTRAAYAERTLKRERCSASALTVLEIRAIVEQECRAGVPQAES